MLFSCPGNVAEWLELKGRLKELAEELLGPVPFNQPPALNVQILDFRERGTFSMYKVCYGSLDDDIVYAWLCIPNNCVNPLPAIICLPGSYVTPNWGKDAVVGLEGPANPGDPEDYGKILAEAGYVTLCPDYPCAGQRVLKGLKPYDTSLLDKKFPNWSRVGMSVWDISRAVDYLLTREEVKADSIAAIGWSQGGEMAVWAGAIDERIKAIASICGWSPWVGRDIVGLQASYNYPRLTNNTPFDHSDIAAMVCPKPFLNISASHDEYYPNVAELKKVEHEICKLYKMYAAADNFKPVHLTQKHRMSPETIEILKSWFHKFLSPWN